MSRSLLAQVAITGISVVSLASLGCSRESPSAPSAAAADVGTLAARPEKPREKPAGVYELIFLGRSEPTGPLAPVTSPVPVNTDVALSARVLEQSTGLPATGTVTYEICSWRGDFAPLEKCEEGQGYWKRYADGELAPSGALLAGMHR